MASLRIAENRRLLTVIARLHWQTAHTMPEMPHQYTVRRKAPDSAGAGLVAHLPTAATFCRCRRARAPRSGDAGRRRRADARQRAASGRTRPGRGLLALGEARAAPGGISRGSRPGRFQSCLILKSDERAILAFMSKPTGVGRGGRREGAGRPRGAKTKIYRPHVERVLATEGIMPRQVLLHVMRRHFEAKRWDEAARVAAMVAPYVHPRLSSMTVKPTLSEMIAAATDEELAAFAEEAEAGIATAKPKGHA
jgi:hypothetical protein